MRIVYVTERLPFGPGEAFIVTEARALLDAGHELLVIPIFPGGEVVHADARPLLERCRSIHLGSPGAAARIAGAALRAPGQTTRALRRVVSRQTLRVRNVWAGLKGVCAAGVVRRWGAEHIHAHWATYPATMAMAMSEASGVRWSFTAHRYDIRVNNLLSRKLSTACFARAISRRGAKELAGYTARGTPAPIVLHMGVRVPASAPAVPPASDRVLVAANLVPVKGHAFLIEAFALLAARGVRARLDVVGGGLLRESLGAQVARLGLEDRVAFHGVVPHDELLRRLESGEWRVAVLPSIVTERGEYEGMGVALMEAMSCGVPVVATATGGIPELLHDGAGVMVAPEDPAALAGALERVLRDDAFAAELGARGRQRIVEEFSVQAIAAELVERFAGCRSPAGPAVG